VNRIGVGNRWRRRGAQVGAATLLWMGLAAGSPGAGAQELADFDYENLQARGMGLFTGFIWPSTVEPTYTIGARMDLGYLGPGLRIMPGFTYWSSDYRRSEVRSLEEKLEELIAREQAPGAPVPDVSLGNIRWSDLVLNVDGHLVWSVPALPVPGLTYLGGGVSAHILNGSGESIEGTFVEDLLDRVSVGLNIHGGGEALLTDHLRVFGEGRAELVENLQYLEIRVGVSWIFQGAAPGERR
jgi:hypothetical protein